MGKVITSKDHELAAELFGKVGRREKTTFAERNILNIYQKRMKKASSSKTK